MDRGEAELMPNDANPINIRFRAALMVLGADSTILSWPFSSFSDRLCAGSQWDCFDACPFSVNREADEKYAPLMCSENDGLLPGLVEWRNAEPSLGTSTMRDHALNHGRRMSTQQADVDNI
jgi:hypothetical protein